MTSPPEAENAMQVVNQQLANLLVAVYLHGSAVTGGLRSDSDVDLLVVIDQGLTPALSARLTNDLMKISGRVGDASMRPIELAIVQLGDLSPPTYPARCEFLYGEWLRADFEAGTVPGPVSDPETTLMLAQARQEAISLVGPDASEVLPVIAQSDICRAIGDALPELLASLEGDERNVLLTLARMWHTLETGEFVPKDVAAEWAINRLPPEDAAVLAVARDGYTGERKDHWHTRKHALEHTVEGLRKRVRSAL
jgi:predicted nucleotidyltransferase